MESAASRHSRFNNYDSGDSGSENPRRPQMATTETVFGGGVGTQRLRMSVIADLNEFSGRQRRGSSEKLGEQN